MKLYKSNKIQGETSKIQNQKFYRSTLDAMKAKEASHAKTQEKIQNAMHAPGEKPIGAGVGAGDAPSAEAQKAVVPPANVNEDTEEIPIAGRTKMTVPKKGPDMDVQKETQEKSEEEKEREEKEKKEAEAKSELNDILKRAPGMIPSLQSNPIHANRSSHCLLQILLSLQQESEIDPAGALRYSAETVRR